MNTNRRAVVAAGIGNLLEWYDFAVYGYLASVLAKQFFPPGDEVGALLSTFAAFGVGFVVRPLGGIVIGRLADTRGRKQALWLTILLMAAGTVLIGVLPGYASLGVGASILLVVARVLQGFSAGGEWGGATSFIVEWAAQGRRGWYGSFQQASVAAGLLLGSAVCALLASVLSTAELEQWGWRIPFLLGGLIAPVGLYLRRNIEDTPAWRASQAQPIAQARSGASPALLAARAFGFTIVWTVAYYIALSYLPTYTQKYAGLTRGQALWANSAGLLVLVLAVPLFGRWSDRIGRRPLLLTCCAGFALLSYPLFILLSQAPGLPVVIAVQVSFALMIAAYSGPGPAAIAELFPTRVRSTWMSTGYSLAVAVFGGFAPFIATWLIGWSGSPIAPSFYLIAAALTSALVVWMMPETAHRPLA